MLARRIEFETAVGRNLVGQLADAERAFVAGESVAAFEANGLSVGRGEVGPVDSELPLDFVAHLGHVGLDEHLPAFDVPGLNQLVDFLEKLRLGFDG